MKDQVESLPPSLATQATLVNSSLESAELSLRLGSIAAGHSRLIYAAPERLRQRPFIHALARANISLVVIDEAHCLSMWGHDFRPDYLHIRDALRDLGDPRLLAMTATATPEMMVEIAQQLGRDLQVVNTGVLRDNLFLIARRAENEDHKVRLLLPFVQRQRGSGIIYVNSRESAEKLERQLRRLGINARAYHAGMGPAERTTLQDRFMSGQVRVMVATVAFGMGVDKPDVRFIVHYHPARSLESYTQESGRAGRDGQPSTCLLLHSSADRANLTRWSNEAAVEIEVLRAVYRVLRGLVRGGRELVDEGALRERLEDEGFAEVDLRVAISLLERAALVRRGPDVPRGATVTLRAGAPDHAEDDLWTPFIQAARLEPERPAPVDVQEVARRLAALPGHVALNAVALEDRLLEWQDEQRLTYRGLGRDMLIEMLPPPADAAERMAGILDALGRRNRRRLRSLVAYLDTQRCRHAFIGRHFGQHSPDHCQRCDNCVPVELEEMQPAHGQKIDDADDAVLRLVGQMPWNLGKTGVIEVLKGVAVRRLYAGRTELYGSLAHLSRAAIERAVDRLIEDGELVAEIRDGYRMLGPAMEAHGDGPHLE
jgi:ATP-dependent DNA helicase RecQ